MQTWIWVSVCVVYCYAAWWSSTLPQKETYWSYGEIFNTSQPTRVDLHWHGAPWFFIHNETSLPESGLLSRIKDSIAERKAGYTSLFHMCNHGREYMGTHMWYLQKKFKKVCDNKYTEHVHTLGEHVCRKANLGTKRGWTDTPQRLKLLFWKMKTNRIGKGKFRK